MKYFDKSKKQLQSKKPKRQPDPILKDKKEKPTILGSSQRKRVQKRIQNQFGKKQKSNAKNKNIKEKEEIEEEGEMIEEMMDVEDHEEDSEIDEEEEEISENENNDKVNTKTCKLDIGGDDDDDDEGLEHLVQSDSDDDISMNDDDDAESIIDDSKEDEEDDMVTNINVGDDVIKVTDLDSLNSRIKANMDILEDFKGFREKCKNHCQPRAFYVNQFLEDLCIKFSYNKFLIKKFYDLFNQNLFKFLVASEEDRPLTIRTNTLKARRSQLKENLINRECNVENLRFSKVGMVVFSTKCAIGATPEYLGGQYILQGSSSMLPVMALAPKKGERILDLCCAPGGKTTHIAQIMANTGVLFANDVNKDRLKAVVGNLARMGVMNTVVINHDGRSIHKNVKDFDRVLCDAPCTGTGVISKDKSIKASKDESDLRMLTTTQKQLICAAIDACKVGGYIVYSTCSVLVEENEQVVDYACRKRNVSIVKTDLFGTKGFVNFCNKHFNNKMDRTRRYYPHENNMDGFFVAKLQKRGETKPTTTTKQE